jgi:hypothetical protein
MNWTVTAVVPAAALLLLPMELKYSRLLVDISGGQAGTTKTEQVLGGEGPARQGQGTARVTRASGEQPLNAPLLGGGSGR